MTDKELQDLISLKKYEQPEEGYFEDFLIEFQQRQRSEMLQTSARGLFVERVKAWFSEFGANRSLRWLVGGGLAYAAVALFISLMPSKELSQLETVSQTEGANDIDVKSSNEEIQQVVSNSVTVSMEFSQPVDFSSPKPVFSTEEKFF